MSDLDDIKVNEAGMCKWADVANAGAQMRTEIERLTPYVEAFRREETRADKLGARIDELEERLASARKAVEEMESYRLALAWIERQSTDPKAREIATDALQCAETDDQREEPK